MNKTGRVAVATGPHTIEVQELPLPEVKTGGILAKVRLANICGSDVKTFKLGQSPIGYGLGHEFVAEIQEIGDGVKTDYAGKPVKVGDRIVLPYFITCHTCTPCHEGDFQNCTNAYIHMPQKVDEWPYFGAAFASHFYVHPDHAFYKVPDNLPDKVVVGANCAVSEVYGAILKQLKVNADDTVLVQGSGGLGLFGMAICHEIGAKVIAIDSVDNRLEMAKRFGADLVIDMKEHPTIEERLAITSAFTNGVGVSKVLEVTNNPEAEYEGIQHLATRGKYAVVGNNMAGHTAIFDPGTVCRKSLTMYGILRYDSPVLLKSLEFLSANMDKYPFDELSPEEYPLDDVQRVMELAIEQKIIRACLKP